MSWRRFVRLICLGWCVSACGDAEPTSVWGWGAGDVCFDDDDPSVVTVVFQECAPSCADIDNTTCEATLEGDRIEVVGDSSIIIYPERDCPEGCLEVAATCPLGDDLAPGTYTVVHHGVSSQMELPADTCLEL